MPSCITTYIAVSNFTAYWDAQALSSIQSIFPDFEQNIFLPSTLVCSIISLNYMCRIVDFVYILHLPQNQNLQQWAEKKPWVTKYYIENFPYITPEITAKSWL